MSGVTLTLSCAPLPLSRAEILRYAGAREESEETARALDECLAEIEGKLTCGVCYREFPVRVQGECVTLPFAEIPSRALARNLLGCEHVILLAATVGLAPDRLMARYATLHPTKALFFQAIGTERIEALCDSAVAMLSDGLAHTGYALRPRFSPGYGDLPLSFQREIFAVLEPARHIGLSLNDSLLMSPTKSVTALIGVYKCKE